MPYATQSDYTARFSAEELLQLTDRDGDGMADAGVFDDAVGDASNEIDSYLMVRYQMPLSTVPPVLVRVCCDITRYRLFMNRATAEVLERYNQAVAWLVNVSKGLVQLGVEPPPVNSSVEDDALSSGGCRTFTRESLEDYTDFNRGRP